jgi:hypothetical protein
LNQIAFSFFLFVRDIAEGDLVGWIDSQLEATERSPVANLERTRQEALIGPLREIFGVSDKLLTMALSSLLIGSRDQRPLWFETGVTMVVVDTLVHAFLTRSGILDDCGKSRKERVDLVLRPMNKRGNYPQPSVRVLLNENIQSINKGWGAVVVRRASVDP